MYKFTWSAVMFKYSVAFKAGSQRYPRECPPKNNAAITDLLMTCYTLRQQSFAWKMVYLDTVIGMMNDKL